MNWFEKHLNWTLFLGHALGVVILYSVSFTAFLTQNGPLSVFALLLYVVNIIYNIALAGWVLKKKNQSLWWLLTYLILIGGIVVLVLKNKSKKR